MIQQRGLCRRSLPLTVCAVATAWMLGSICSPSARAGEPKGPDVGDRAIDFELPRADGQGYLSLRDQYKQGPIVLIVLRGFPGYQCPICTQQVSSLANRSKALADQTHRVILVYPGEGDTLEKRARQFMGSRRFPDPLVMVRDDEMRMVDQWGLRWRASRETAYPATYIIDSSGEIRWKTVSRSHAGRSSVEDILKELRKL